MSRDIIIGAILLVALLGALFLRDTSRTQRKPGADTGPSAQKDHGEVPKKPDAPSTSGSPAWETHHSKDQSAQAGPANSRNTPHPVSSSDSFRYQHSTSPEQALQDEDPKKLAATVLAYKNSPPESWGSLYPSLNALVFLSRQGSIAAVDELILLAEQFKDDRVRHQILQALGQSDQPGALQALFSALGQSLGDPIETARISSYFPLTLGFWEPRLVDAMLGYARDPSASPESRDTLLGAAYYKGGAYGREQVRQLDPASAARFEAQLKLQASRSKKR